MPLIRFREKEMSDEAKVFIFGSVEKARIFLNGEEIKVHRGLFYVDSDLLIRHVEHYTENFVAWLQSKDGLKRAELALSWLHRQRMIPDEGLVPFQDVGEAIKSFVGEMIDEKIFNYVECPACGSRHAREETRLYYWCEETWSSRYDGHVLYCSRSHVIRHSHRSISTISRDPSAMNDPIYDKPHYTLIEKFAPESTV